MLCTDYSLAIHPSPFRNESLQGWIRRLAYLNYIEPIELFINRKGYLNYEHFIFKKYISKARWNQYFRESHLYSESPSGMQNFWWSVIYKQDSANKFCPYCFHEMEIPYYKKEWSYKWLCHCIDHGTPLVFRCNECTQAIRYRKSRHLKWMACDDCLAITKSWNNVSYNPEKHLQKVSPHIRKTIKLIEKHSMDKIDIWTLCKIFALSQCMLEDRSYYSQHNYYILKQLNIHPLEYLTSKVITYDRYGNIIDGLSADQALACAWDILEKRPHLIPEIAKWGGVYSRSITRTLKGLLVLS